MPTSRSATSPSATACTTSGRCSSTSPKTRSRCRRAARPRQSGHLPAEQCGLRNAVQVSRRSPITASASNGTPGRHSGRSRTSRSMLVSTTCSTATRHSALRRQAAGLHQRQQRGDLRRARPQVLRRHQGPLLKLAHSPRLQSREETPGSFFAMFPVAWAVVTNRRQPFPRFALFARGAIERGGQLARDKSDLESSIEANEAEGAVLGLLARVQPLSRYQILRFFQNSPARFQNVSKGSLTHSSAGCWSAA